MELLLSPRRDLARSMGVDECDVLVSIQKKTNHLGWRVFDTFAQPIPGNSHELFVSSFLKKGMKFIKDAEKSQYFGSVPGLKDRVWCRMSQWVSWQRVFILSVIMNPVASSIPNIRIHPRDLFNPSRG